MALSKPDNGINTLLHLYVRDSMIKLENEDNPRNYEESRLRFSDNAEDIANRISSFYLEVLINVTFNK